METVYTWRGRDIETLTREELLEALRLAMRGIENARRAHMDSIDLYTSVLRAW